MEHLNKVKFAMGPFVLSLALLAPVAYGADEATASDKDTCDEVCRIKEHLRKSFMILAPRFSPIAHNGHHSAFTNNGFDRPASSMPTFSFIFGKRMDSGFDLGLNITQGRQNTERGGFEASYEYTIAGFYVGYDLLPESNTDVTLGSTLGYSWSGVDVLSAAQDGRVYEGAMVWEPSVAIAQKVTDNFKLGLVASYLLPFGTSRTVMGDDTGANGFAPRGANIGLQFIFGRFGADSAK